ncbi:unnamed protein product [Adineta ricciae]|uniref:Uncharacterized protein n=1 Tax=Adineta ricciae TaxID=249248 RepID=A0A815UF48_ADIRI|nr:unnamed protein product [Adineta ricciae]CAF1513101.1 unnamed protein product [Adineta ricciae]
MFGGHGHGHGLGGFGGGNPLSGGMMEMASDWAINRYVPGGLHSPMGMMLDNMIGGNPNGGYGGQMGGFGGPMGGFGGQMGGFGGGMPGGYGGPRFF